MKVSDWIIDFLATHGVDTFFGYIGGMVTHLVDSASRDSRVQFIQTYHEQSAAFAAEGYARTNGVPGVAIATSGPGALNLLTGVGNAYFDSIPVLYLTGQVNTSEYKYNKPIRQQGFQETDIVAMATPVTKYCVMVDRPENVCFELEKAWSLLWNGRPGPVLIDLPMDVQRSEIDPDHCALFCCSPNTTIVTPVEKTRDLIMEALQNAKRPLLLLGGGCHHCSLRNELNKLVAYGFPTVVSLQGKGSVSEDIQAFIGMLGSYGNRAANLAVARADLLLVLGSRLDTRQTGVLLQYFSKGKRIIHVDVDHDEMTYHRLPNREVLYERVETIIKLLNQELTKIKFDGTWIHEVQYLKKNYSQRREVERFVEQRLPYDALLRLACQVPENVSFFIDVGQNQMWAAQALCLHGRQDFFTSGGMASMGYAIPAAIGAALATRRQRRIVVVCGDGGFQIALQSLALISQYRLPIIIIIMNNHSLGMITQFQALYFQSNFAATMQSGGYNAPNCEACAQAFQLPFQKAGTKDEFFIALSKLGEQGILELSIPAPTIVSPKLEYNKPLFDMSPSLPEQELQQLLAGEMVVQNKNVGKEGK